MRIISGILKGKKIILPVDKLTRPLRDLVKESIFNVLNHSNKINFNIENSTILDLFSGSGSFGLEAYSRGAKKIIFVENYITAFKILNKNIEILNCQKSCISINQNCFEYLENINDISSKFDLIFLDPPFKEKEINILLENIKNKKILKKNGLIIIHRHKKDNIILTSELNIIEERSYGISKIIFCN